MEIEFKKEFFENYMRENNLSVKEFCKLCKIDVRVYNKIMNNKTNIRIKSLVKIARALNVKVSQFIDME